eukprot:628704-Rhodomonas_salina.3
MAAGERMLCAWRKRARVGRERPSFLEHTADGQWADAIDLIAAMDGGCLRPVLADRSGVDGRKGAWCRWLMQPRCRRSTS